MSCSLCSEPVLGELLINAVRILAPGFSLVGYRGFYHVCRLLGRPFRGSCRLIELAPDAAFEVDLGDPYWLPIVSKRYRYEPDVERVLDLFGDMDVFFVDGGANQGYWSILVTGKHRRWQVVAVEASPQTFRKLRRNAILNQDRFLCLNLGISRESGHELIVLTEAGQHAGAHVRETRPSPDGGILQETVKSISLDDLVGAHRRRHASLTIIKIDVEGQELAALDGATNVLLEETTLWIYEDHGADPSCSVTRRFLDLGFLVFFPMAKGLKSIRTIDEIRVVKTRSAVGYNFVACRAGTSAARLIAENTTG